MPKTWSPGDAKKFARQVQLGKSYYVAMKIAQNLSPYEDSKLYSEIVFTARRPITHTPCAGSMDAVSLCQNYGPVYEQPPAGMRNIAGPGRQVAGPVPQGYEGVLDEVELRGLGKQVAQGSDPRKRGPLGSWRA
jgi:hypothetical protein